MELKFYRESCSPVHAFGFNCTFMELKSSKQIQDILKRGVLIVPLWN